MATRRSRLHTIRSAFDRVLDELDSRNDVVVDDMDDFADGFQHFRRARTVGNHRGRALSRQANIRPLQLEVVILPKFSSSFKEIIRQKGNYDQEIFFVPHKISLKFSSSHEDLLSRLKDVCQPLGLAGVQFSWYKLDVKKDFHLIGGNELNARSLKDHPTFRRSKFYVIPEEGVDLSTVGAMPETPGPSATDQAPAPSADNESFYSAGTPTAQFRSSAFSQDLRPKCPLGLHTLDELGEPCVRCDVAKQYEESLAADRLQSQREVLKVRRQNQMKELRRLRSQNMKPEGTDIVVKFQHSQGSCTRSFNNEDTWADLVNFVGSLDDSTEDFGITAGQSSYHTKKMTMAEILAEKLSGRIVLYIQWEEKEDLDDQTLSTDSLPDLEEPRSPSPPPPFVSRTSTTHTEWRFLPAFEDSVTDNTRTLRIRRSFVEEDLVDAFSDETIMGHTVRIAVVGETAVDDGGVFKDILTQFWNTYMEKFFEGEVQAVPLVVPQCDGLKFQALGRIIVLGWEQLGYFPLRFSQCTLLASLFGSDVLSKEDLVEGFYKFLGDESKLLKECLVGESWDTDQTNDIIEVVARYGVTVQPSPQNLPDLVLRCAEVTLLERPLFGMQSMEIIKLKQHPHFHSPGDVRKLYLNLQPTNRKVAKLLMDSTTASTVAEQRVLDFLVRAVRAANQELLLKFLRFATGSDALSGEMFVQFVTATGLSRRIVSHTCSNTIDLPVSYTSYNEFHYEFKQQLNTNDWCMDFA